MLVEINYIWGKRNERPGKFVENMTDLGVLVKVQIGDLYVLHIEIGKSTSIDFSKRSPIETI